METELMLLHAYHVVIITVNVPNNAANFDVNGALTVTSGNLDISSYTAIVSGATV